MEAGWKRQPSPSLRHLTDGFERAGDLVDLRGVAADRV
jgi:hypothetical protein